MNVETILGLVALLIWGMVVVGAVIVTIYGRITNNAKLVEDALVITSYSMFLFLYGIVMIALGGSKG